MKRREKMMECPGCGLRLPDQQIERPHRYNATGECYQKYNELSFYTMSQQDLHFVHQHAIDTYSAQHAGAGMKNITVAFSLIGLYYAIELGFTGKQVQRVHMLLSQRPYNWPSLPLPENSYLITVQDVLKEKPGKNRDVMLREWMYDVWRCWEYQPDWVKNISNHLLR
ncbi:DUF5946 family protein [Bacillus smithii]|uniref:DUF5946 family protein n=1 Tax=Bacillus smithii TaxID=1479 RepID=UPI003D19900C